MIIRFPYIGIIRFPYIGGLFPLLFFLYVGYIYRIPFIIGYFLFLCLFLVIISEIRIIVCDYIIIDMIFIFMFVFG